MGTQAIICPTPQRDEVKSDNGNSGQTYQPRRPSTMSYLTFPTFKSLPRTRKRAQAQSRRTARKYLSQIAN